ncbi:hypothetical protein ABLB90_12975 [Photorhabdus bodei]
MGFFIIDLNDSIIINLRYTQWISRWIATARERIPGSIDNYVTGVSECSQQRGNLKDDGYISILTQRAIPHCKVYKFPEQCLKSNFAINLTHYSYTLWISRWIATARERILGSIDNYVTGVSECSQQRGNLKDDGYSNIVFIGRIYLDQSNGSELLFFTIDIFLKRNKLNFPAFLMQQC